MKPAVEEAYLAEIVLQADYALTSAIQVDALLRDGTNTAIVFKELYAFLAHVAGVSRVLWPPRIHEPAHAATANSRALHLRNVLKLADDNPLRSRTLRDHLEHFDERLDRWSQQTTHGGIVDLHVGPLSILGGVAISPGDCLRAYDPTRMVFTFRGDAFDMGLLANATKEIRASAADRMAALRMQG